MDFRPTTPFGSSSTPFPERTPATSLEEQSSGVDEVNELLKVIKEVFPELPSPESHEWKESSFENYRRCVAKFLLNAAQKLSGSGFSETLQTDIEVQKAAFQLFSRALACGAANRIDDVQSQLQMARIQFSRTCNDTSACWNRVQSLSSKILNVLATDSSDSMLLKEPDLDSIIYEIFQQGDREFFVENLAVYDVENRLSKALLESCINLVGEEKYTEAFELAQSIPNPMMRTYWLAPVLEGMFEEEQIDQALKLVEELPEGNFKTHCLCKTYREYMFFKDPEDKECLDRIEKLPEGVVKECARKSLAYVHKEFDELTEEERISLLEGKLEDSESEDLPVSCPIRSKEQWQYLVYVGMGASIEDYINEEPSISSSVESHSSSDAHHE